jgi:hypothetical protein
MGVTSDLIVRGLAELGTRLVKSASHEKLASRRWLDDSDLNKLCAACKAAKPRKAGKR